MKLKLMGGFLLLFGIADFCLNLFASIDIWSEVLGFDLFLVSEWLWRYIPWINMGAGALIWLLGDLSPKRAARL